VFICVHPWFQFALVRAGFGGGVHAVLWDFVNAAWGRFLVRTIKMIERAGTFSDRVTFFDCFRHVGFGEQDGFAQRTAAGQLRGNRRRERASRSVRIFTFQMIAA
jgi:hypothetical protein